MTKFTQSMPNDNLALAVTRTVLALARLGKMTDMKGPVRRTAIHLTRTRPLIHWPMERKYDK